MSGDPELPGGTSGSRARAAELFAAFVARREAGDVLELEQLCGAHPELAAELRGIASGLADTTDAAADAASSGPTVSIESSAVRGAAPAAELFARLALRRRSGPARHRIEGEIGRGGMGAVLRVWDDDLRRTLALKVALERRSAGDAADERALARFLEEAQVTGQLDHPGIVPVHELGLDAQGRVCFTMKLVQGESLERVLERLARGEGGWNQTRAVGVLERVCEAMSYAHSKGVVHRDLKPANVMVGRFGEVYVMDWGLARVLGAKDEKDVRIRPPTLVTSEIRTDRRERAGSDPDSPLYTMDGDVVGTPAYMSPEQAGGRIADVGPRSDVYAAGAMLYQLLSGEMPYVRTGVRINAYAVWARVQEGPPLAIAELAPNAPAELLSICERAMARDPAQRYADMGELAEDLRAYLEHRVVRAYRTGSVAELVKWVERNRALAATAAAAVLLFLALAAIYSAVVAGKNADLSQANTALDRKSDEALASVREAERQREEAERQREEAERLQNAAEAARDDASAAKESAERSKEGAEWQAYLASLYAARSAIDREAPRLARSYLERVPAHLRGWEWNRIQTELASALLVLDARAGCVHALAFSPDGARIAAACKDGSVRIWDAASGRAVGALAGHARAVVSVAFSPDGTRIASASWDGTARLWEVDSWNLVAVLEGHTDGMKSVAFSPDGRHLVSGISQGTETALRLWDARSGEPVATLVGQHSKAPTCLAFSPDGSRLASRDSDATVRLWDAGSGAALGALEGDFCSLAFSPVGSLLATAGAAPAYPAVRLWDFVSAQPVGALAAHSVECVAFSPDGSVLASGAYDDTVRLWDVARRAETAVLKTRGNVEFLAFSPDGSRVAAHDSWDVRVLAATTGRLHGILAQGARVMCLAFSPDGSRLATGCLDGTIRLWDPCAGDVLPALDGLAVTLSTDGARLARVTGQGVELWDLTLGERLAFVEHELDEVIDLDVTDDGFRLAWLESDHSARVWNVRTGEIDALGAAASARSWIRLSRDGSRLLAGPPLEVWDTASGECLLSLGAALECVAISPDGIRLASASKHTDTEARTVDVWSARTGERLAELVGHTDLVTALVFNPDGTLLVSGSRDRSVRIWNVGSRASVAVRDFAYARQRHAFSPDGTLLVSSMAYGRTPQLWDASSGEVRLLEGGMDGNAWAFAPDGARLACSDGASVCLWSMPSGELAGTLEGHMQGIDALAFSPDGLRLVSVSADETARVWHVASGELLDVIPVGPYPRGVAFEPSGATLVLESFSEVRLAPADGDYLRRVRSVGCDEERTRSFRRLQALLRARRIRAGLERLPHSLGLTSDPALAQLDAGELNGRAWPLVDPDRETFGDELLGLALARLAVERAGAELLPAVLDTQAWACFANGLDDEALAASERALELAPEDRKKAFRGYLDHLRGAIEKERRLLFPLEYAPLSGG